MGIGSFGWTNKFRKVLVGWNEVLMPNGTRIRVIASDVPCTYGMDANWGCSVGVQGVGLSRLGHAFYGFSRVPI